MKVVTQWPQKKRQKAIWQNLGSFQRKKRAEYERLAWKAARSVHCDSREKNTYALQKSEATFNLDTRLIWLVEETLRDGVPF